MNRSTRCLSLPLCAALMCSCALQGPSHPTPVPELKPGRLIGHLPMEERIDSRAILPAPTATKRWTIQQADDLSTGVTLLPKLQTSLTQIY